MFLNFPTVKFTSNYPKRCLGPKKSGNRMTLLPPDEIAQEKTKMIEDVPSRRVPAERGRCPVKKSLPPSFLGIKLKE